MAAWALRRCAAVVAAAGLLRPLRPPALCGARALALCRPPAPPGPPARLLAPPAPPLRPILGSVAPLFPSILHQQVRTAIRFSLRKGKRKTVKAVVHRFLRFHCGLWLRRRAGYKKRLWKKSSRRKYRLRQHVFCNKTQCKLLDRMTTSFWKRRNWYANDPYQKYHDRTNLNL